MSKRNKIIFSIVNGDFLVHNLKDKYKLLNHNDIGYDLFVKKTIKYVSEKINKSIHSIDPKIEIYPVLGNNDSYNYNYQIDDEDGQFYSETAETWKNLFSSIQSTDFIHNGYYFSKIKELNLKLIILNSNLFSSLGIKYPSNKDIIKRADYQLNWLETALKEAKKNKESVLISFHIPAAVDEFKSSTSGEIVPYWNKELQSKYYDIIKKNNEIILGILNSHTHNDELHVDLYNDKKINIFSVFIPSISPIHSNNPGFKIIYLPSKNNFISRNKIQDYDYYFYDYNLLDIKFGYNFNEIYHSNNMQEGIQSIVKGKNMKLYLDNLNFRDDKIEYNKLKYYTCSVKYVLKEDYKNCLSHK